MSLYKPSYYDDFVCIADKCRHNCCIGWEIDVDEDTYEYYKSLSEPYGKEILKGISVDNGTTHFCMREDGRCPFLNENNLCDIIIHLGEEGLCDICHMHPRFVNGFDNRTEIGVGLSCEAAAKLIIGYKDKFNLVCDCEEDVLSAKESKFFDLRQSLMNVIADRSDSMSNRLCRAYALLNLKDDFDYKKLADIFADLEYLEDCSKGKFTSLSQTDYVFNVDGDFNIPVEQMLIYFIYRHLSEGVYDGMITERFLFAVFSTLSIVMLTVQSGNMSFDALCESARIYSTEIEYCEDNTEKIISRISDLCCD